MRKRTSSLLTTAAAAALVCGMAGSASAFEVVDWEWNKVINENVTIGIVIQNVLVPTGLVEIEKLQMYFGDVKAVAKVENINNRPPGDVGDGNFSERFNVVLNYEESDGGDATESEDNPILAPGGGSLTAITPLGLSGINLSLVDQGGGNLGEVDENSEIVRFQLDVSGSLLAGGSFLAEDLPKIENAATAVANNQSITSDVPIMLHDAQFYAGGFHIFGTESRQGENGDQALVGLILAIAGFNEFADDNLHTALALGLTGLAMGGILEKGEVEAKAKVSDILNAYVENSATAVVNNASFKIESGTPQDHILIADLTQWAYADTTAKAKVENVNINGYAGFGEACFGGLCEEDGFIKPIVSNTATAVGNNLNIKVGTVLE